MRKKRKKAVNTNNSGIHEIIGLLIVSLGLFLTLTIYSQGNSAGVVGLWAYPIVKGLFGIISYILPVTIIIIGILVIAARSKKINRSKMLLSILSIYFFFCFIHLLYFKQFDSQNVSSFIAASYAGGKEALSIGAGAVCAPVVYMIYSLFGLPGAFIFFITAALISPLLLTNLSLKQMGIRISHSLKLDQAAKTLADSRENRMKKREQSSHDITQQKKKLPNFLIDPEPKPSYEQGESEAASALHTESSNELPLIKSGIKIIDFQANKEQISKIQTKEREQKIHLVKDELSIPEIEVHQESLPYMIPPISLLREPLHKKSSTATERSVKNTAKLLEETLQSFGVSARVLQISCGPVITRYELQPASGVKVSRIVSLADDIALNLAAPAVRIEAPIPGKAAVGIEVPNKDTSPVMLREVLDSDNFLNHPSKIAFALGKDIAGNNIIADITNMPHLLIAGATGSGKSVCLNSLIISILYKATPDEVRFIMVDPKVGELSSFNGIPHLMIPVVTDPRKAAGALNWAVQEMTNRYKMFAEKGVRDIERYNEQIGENDKPLPQILVIIDELSDLMMIAPSEVEDAICRLAQMARAAGIHLVIATQRPSVDVITGVIKANIPSRIAFEVSSQTDSRTILDAGGAEKLLGKGDMLYLPSGSNKPKRVQGAFITEKEVESIVSCIKNQNEGPQYNMEVLEETLANQTDGDNGFDDELLPEAIEVVVDAGQASISMIQRRLRVGYARAARLVDEMEVRGLVSGFDGSKPRNVLISREEFEEQFKKF